jgi:hypothetical protein
LEENNYGWATRYLVANPKYNKVPSSNSVGVGSDVVISRSMEVEPIAIELLNGLVRWAGLVVKTLRWM